MSEKKDITNMPRSKYDLKTPEDLDFLVSWIRVLFIHDKSIQGTINSYTLALTNKYLSIDQSGMVSVCEVEK